MAAGGLRCGKDQRKDKPYSVPLEVSRELHTSCAVLWWCYAFFPPSAASCCFWALLARCSVARLMPVMLATCEYE